MAGAHGRRSPPWVAIWSSPRSPLLPLVVAMAVVLAHNVLSLDDTPTAEWDPSARQPVQDPEPVPLGSAAINLGTNVASTNVEDDPTKQLDAGAGVKPVEDTVLPGSEGNVSENPDGLSHLPAEALDRLKSRQQTLPGTFYQFSGIAIGQQRYPAAARFTTATVGSECVCRHRCLVEPRCLGYEYELASGTCGITDVLLAAAETRLTEAGWSTGRRHGASWLQQPCTADADCRLLVSGAVHCSRQEDSQTDTCLCQSGWTPAGPLACQKNGRWVALTSTLLAGQPLGQQQQQPTLAQCQQTCASSEDCRAVQFSDGACLQYGTAEQRPPPTTQPIPVTSYVWQFERSDGSRPAGYIEAAGTWLRLTDEVTSSQATMACLQLGGIPYAPDNAQKLKSVVEAFNSEERYGIAANDILKKGNFITIDGNVLSVDLWARGQPNLSDNERCTGVGWGSRLLHDISCIWPVLQLCEFVGEDLLSDVAGKQQPQQKSDTVWWVYDFGSVLQVSQVLYVANRSSASEDLQWTELRVGSSAADYSLAALCRRQDGTFVAAGFGRRFTCHVPLAGRYLYVGQATKDGQKQWDKIAVFGNRYEEAATIHTLH